MDKHQRDLSYFISFCIEQYKNAKEIDGAEAMEIFSKYGLLEYLEEHYEILHTQNHHWILEDIDKFLEIRKKENL
jgi:hypothetical protein